MNVLMFYSIFYLIETVFFVFGTQEQANKNFFQLLDKLIVLSYGFLRYR